MGKKITWEEFEDALPAIHGWSSTDPDYSKKAIAALWSRIQEAQSDEPMTVEEIRAFLAKSENKWSMDREESLTTITWDVLLKDIQPLTRRQGISIDWKDFPCAKEEVTLEVYEKGRWLGTLERIKVPPKPLRPRTREEKIEALNGPDAWFWYVTAGRIDSRELAEATLDDLLKAVGIPLEVPQ